MGYQKQPLIADEKLALEDLIKVAGGMGMLTDRSSLTDDQDVMAEILSRRGYVTLTKKKFMVVIPP